MNKLQDSWEDVKYFLEEHKWFKWLTTAMVVISIGLLLFNGFIKKEETVPEGDVATSDSTSEELDEDRNLEGVSKEAVHILMNPEQYTEDEVSRAYNESLTTFDNTFVEEHVYTDSGLLNGVYLYHEKANDEYTEVAKLAKEVSELGVPVYFYTPQADQSIARVANQTPVLEDGVISVKGFVVRDYTVEDEMAEIRDVKTYLEGVISENK